MITPVARLEVHISNPSALTDLKKAAPARDGLDNRTSGGYTEHEKGAAGRRLAQDFSSSKEVTALFGRRGGYFFLLAIIKRPIMPTTKMPVWIRSEYVTIGQPPFPWIRGQKLPPVGGQPPAVCWQRQGQDTTLFAKAQPRQVSNPQALADLKRSRPTGRLLKNFTLEHSF